MLITDYHIFCKVCYACRFKITGIKMVLDKTITAYTLLHGFLQDFEMSLLDYLVKGAFVFFISFVISGVEIRTRVLYGPYIFCIGTQSCWSIKSPVKKWSTSQET